MDKNVAIVSVNIFYRCPECGENHEVTHLDPDESGRWVGVIAYLCDKCGSGVAVVQTRVKAVHLG